MSEPIVFATPAEVELDPAPIPSSWIIEGEPQARSKRLATSKDRSSSVMAWSCTTGRFRWYYNIDETVHIIAGEVFVTDHIGASRRLGPGDVAFFPAGSVSQWHVTKTVRKLAVCRHAMPWPLGFALRAWNKLGVLLAGPGEEADPLAARPSPDNAQSPRNAVA